MQPVKTTKASTKPIRSIKRPSRERVEVNRDAPARRRYHGSRLTHRGALRANTMRRKGKTISAGPKAKYFLGTPYAEYRKDFAALRQGHAARGNVM